MPIPGQCWPLPYWCFGAVRFREPALAALLFGGSLYFGAGISGKAAELRGDGPSMPKTLAEWIGRVFSLRKAGADKYWIDILQYCGGRAFSLDRGDGLVKLSSMATDLDPRFRYVYVFSGSMLMWHCRRPVEAAELLRKGIANNPDDAKLKLYLAAFTYSRLNDLARQVVVLEELAMSPGTPPMLYRMLANVYMKQGRRGQALKMWVFIAEHSEDWLDREWAKGKLAKYRR